MTTLCTSGKVMRQAAAARSGAHGVSMARRQSVHAPFGGAQRRNASGFRRRHEARRQQMFNLKGDASRLRARSRAFVCVATLIASQTFAAAAAVKSSQSQVRSARIILQLDVDKPSRAVWCYDTEPAFVFSKDSSLLRYDTSGKLIEKLDFDFRAASIFCSDDGKVMYFTNPRGDRWWIYSKQHGLSEYAVTVPPLY